MLGSRLVPLLTLAGFAVRVLTRDPARAEPLAGHGVEVTCAPVQPALARQARAALAMDTLDMTFGPGPARQVVPSLPETSVRQALKELLSR